MISPVLDILNSVDQVGSIRDDNVQGIAFDKRGNKTMIYLEEIRAGHNNPQSLENVYQAARRANEADAFKASLLICYDEAPDNVLYAAWFYRLQALPEGQADARNINWKLAAPLSVALGLIFWVLSAPRFELPVNTPYLVVIWAPIVSCFVIAFMAVTAGKPNIRSLLMAIGMISAIIYVTYFSNSPGRARYRDLMIAHLPLLAWIGVGVSILGSRSDHRERFAFLAKSVEVFVTGGIFLIAGGAFMAITFGMFDALDIVIPDTVTRLLLAGGSGLVPVLAVASAYDPLVRPAAQRFEEGVGKLISTLMRILLPLTLLVLIVYLAFIPFNFMEPFNKREVLVVYNAMLFAIMGLLIGVTPVDESDLAQQHRSVLRRSVLAVAVLAVLIGLYAMSATVYRTMTDDAAGLTMNRLTIIGWNSINIGILSLLIYRYIKAGPREWVQSLQSTLGMGTTGYVAWTVFLIVAIPFLFKG